MPQIAYEQSALIRGPDGSVMYLGAWIANANFHFLNGESTNAFNPGEAIKFDPAAVTSAVGSFIPRLEAVAGGSTPNADQPNVLTLHGLRIAGATDTGFIGVSVGKYPVGAMGMGLGVGSICGCVVVTSDTTQLTQGQSIGGSSTPGAATNNTTATQMLGTVLKINGTGATATGSKTWAGILVQPR